VALSDEACPCQSQAMELRAERALLGPSTHVKARDRTAKGNFYEDLPNELIFLRSLEAQRHIAIARWCGEKPMRLVPALLIQPGVIGSIWGVASLSRSALVAWPGPQPTHDTHDRREGDARGPALPALRTRDAGFSL